MASKRKINKPKASLTKYKRLKTTSVLGSRPFRDQVGYITDLNTSCTVGDTDIIRGLLDYAMLTIPASQFWDELNRLRTSSKSQLKESVNVSEKTQEPPVNESVNDAVDEPTKAPSDSLQVNETASVTTAEESGENSLLRLVTIFIVVGLGLTSLAAWPLTFEAKAEIDSLRRANTQLQADLSAAKTIGNKRFEKLTNVMLESWARLPNADADLIKLSRERMTDAREKLSKNSEAQRKDGSAKIEHQ